MRCLVTGNHGFIGYIMTHELLKNGHEVVGYDYDYFPKETFGRPDTFESSKGIKQITKDVRDISSEDLKGIDAVIHLAGLPNDTAGDVIPDITMDINYLSTMELAIRAKRSGVKRFLFSSTASVYGAQEGDILIDEESKPNPITHYGISKFYSEIALLNMNSENFAVTCMRNTTCYGVSPRMRFDMVLNTFVGTAYTEKKLKMLNDGMIWRPLVHIEDVAAAFNIVLKTDVSKVAGQRFIIGSETQRIIDLAKTVKEFIPEAVIEYENNNRDPRSYRLNCEKAKKVLGFVPKRSIKDGIKELLAAYDDFKLTKEKFDDKRFWAAKYYRYLVNSGQVDNNLRWKTK